MRYYQCPECEASFTALADGKLPPHKFLRADCPGAGSSGALAVGDRIRAAQYGEEKTGTVTRIGRSVVFVQFDDSPRERWLHASSVKRA